MDSVRLIASPWKSVLEEFADSVQRSAWIAAPFITAPGLSALTTLVRRRRPPDIAILTNLSVDNLLTGSTDPRALADFSRALRTSVTIRHLASLHAKVYVADEHTALVTSANLTDGGLLRNHEYGVKIDSTHVVGEILRDLQGYSELGSEITYADLDKLAEAAGSLRESRDQIVRSANTALQGQLQARLDLLRENMLWLRARPGESTNSIFARTILYLLRDGPLPTAELHPKIRRLHPDLCDDTLDRVINGVHFGKQWKHAVRNAQQSLKSQGRIVFDGRYWRLTAV